MVVALIFPKFKKGSIKPTLQQIVAIIIIVAILALLYVSIKKAGGYIVPG